MEDAYKIDFHEERSVIICDTSRDVDLDAIRKQAYLNAERMLARTKLSANYEKPKNAGLFGFVIGWLFGSM